MADNSSVSVSAAPAEFANAPAIPMPDNNAVVGQMLFEKAKTEYPYLADKDIAFDYAPAKGRGFLEFYSPEETVSGGELPRKTAEFLLSLASEADAVVIQLSACQAVLRSEREN